MPAIKIINRETSIQVPLKSGHRLMFSVFKELFNNFNIDYKISSSTDILSKNIIFVRNPIDRFFSSYFWLDSLNESPEISKILKKYKIVDLSSFIDVYEEFSLQVNDFHYSPQSQEILTKNISLFNKINYKVLYDNTYPLGYEIYKIEDLDKMVFDSCKWATINENFGFLSTHNTKTIFDSRYYSKYSFLNFLSDLDSVNVFFNLYYIYFKSVYDYSKHHQDKKYKNIITNSNYEKVYNMFNDELIFFGYK